MTPEYRTFIVSLAAIVALAVMGGIHAEYTRESINAITIVVGVAGAKSLGQRIAESVTGASSSTKDVQIVESTDPHITRGPRR